MTTHHKRYNIGLEVLRSCSEVCISESADEVGSRHFLRLIFQLRHSRNLVSHPFHLVLTTFKSIKLETLLKPNQQSNNMKLLIALLSLFAAAANADSDRALQAIADWDVSFDSIEPQGFTFSTGGGAGTNPNVVIKVYDIFRTEGPLVSIRASFIPAPTLLVAFLSTLAVSSRRLLPP
jgi:hypothetical protein